MTRRTILILAAGASRRMQGRDKLLEQIDGESLLRRVVRMACAVEHADVYVALPARPHPRYGEIDGLPVRRVEVVDAAEGMAASLRSGIAALDPSPPNLMILLADMPDLTTGDLETLWSATGQSALVWRGATQDGTPGHPLIIDQHLFPAFQALEGDVGGKSVLANVLDETVFVPLHADHAVTDLDTPEAWASWRKKTGR